MTSGTNPANKSPDEIAREIDADRGEIKRTVEELQERISLGAAIDRLGTMFSDTGSGDNGLGEIGRKLQGQAKENPLPLLLVGAGVVLMFAGGGPSTREIRDGAARAGDSVRRGARSLADRASPDDDAGYRDLYDDVLYDEDPFILPSLRSEPHVLYAASSGRPLGVEASHPMAAGAPDEETIEEARARARAAQERARAVLGNRTDSAEWGSRDARSGVGDAADAVRARAADAGAAARDGLEAAGSSAADAYGRMSAEARERFESARQRAAETAEVARLRASDARHAIAEQARRGADEASDLFEKYPLAAGAIAFAVGAGLGGAVPNTRTEDRLMGERAEHLRRKARERAIEEARKARRVAEAAAEEAIRIADEHAAAADDRTEDGRTMVHRAEGAVSDAADRIVSRAEAEASRQDIGRSGPG